MAIDKSRVLSVPCYWSNNAPYWILAYGGTLSHCLHWSAARRALIRIANLASSVINQSKKCIPLMVVASSIGSHICWKIHLADDHEGRMPHIPLALPVPAKLSWKRSSLWTAPLPDLLLLSRLLCQCQWASFLFVSHLNDVLQWADVSRIVCRVFELLHTPGGVDSLAPLWSNENVA